MVPCILDLETIMPVLRLRTISIFVNRHHACPPLRPVTWLKIILLSSCFLCNNRRKDWWMDCQSFYTAIQIIYILIVTNYMLIV